MCDMVNNMNEGGAICKFIVADRTYLIVIGYFILYVTTKERLTALLINKSVNTLRQGSGLCAYGYLFCAVAQVVINLTTRMGK